MLGSHDKPTGVAAALSPEEVWTRSASLDEQHVYVRPTLEDVPQLASEPIPCVESGISLHANLRALRQNSAKHARRLASVALAPRLRSIDLDEAHTCSVVEAKRVAVQHSRYDRRGRGRLLRRRFVGDRFLGGRLFAGGLVRRTHARRETHATVRTPKHVGGYSGRANADTRG